MTDDTNLSNLKKDPEDWKTGDERATEAQKSYIHTMTEEADEEVDIDSLSKAEAAEVIERLQQKTDRGHPMEE